MLFFSIIALQPINPMYSYSLSSYIVLYQDAFDKAEQSTYIKQRITNVNEMLIQLVYNTITRALFEKDKLLFSFIITIKQLELKKHLDHSELQFLINPI